MWKQRCEILHQESNKYNVADDEELTKKLLWYKQHRREVLGRQDWYMTQYNKNGLRRMQRKTKRRWLRNLDTVMAAYEKERRERPKGVPPITNYFRRVEEEGTTLKTGSRASAGMRGNPARSPGEAAYPVSDAVT